MIELKNTKKWGKERLFSTDTWGDIPKNHRQAKADEVVDTFHRLAKEAGVMVQWLPKVPALRGEDVKVGDVTNLERLLERAYEEAR